MKKDSSWTVLHDINIFINPNERYALACRYLFGHVVSEEKITPVPDEKYTKFANIGAFKVSDITLKHTENLFEALLIPFNIHVSSKDLADINGIIKKYYTREQYKFFCDIIETQEYMFKHPRSFVSLIKGSIKQKAGPELFTFLQKIKRSLRIK